MSYTFFRWFRAGMAASLEPLQTAAVPRRATLTLGVDVGATGLTSQTTTVALDVLGPGDVTGIDARQVIRAFPVANAVDAASTYFAHVEFDRPDLPWLFTPFGPTPAGILRPWMALVVVELGDHAKLDAAIPLPRLTVSGTEVPRLTPIDQAHAWAHVQIAGDASRGAATIAAEEPERILSRLVCPRILEPGKSYLACVVPTFTIGALAGLGQDLPATLPVDAWAGTAATVQLPVYYYWQFATGGAGDFRSLVQRLEPRPTLPGVGTRPLDISAPEFGLAARTTTTTIPLGGVFRVDEPAAAPVDQGLAADLAPLVNATDAVGPSMYGRWHAALTTLRIGAGATPGWPETLNLDPRYRVAAGLGTRVVQEQQEDLMAAIWEQLGEILRANQLLRQAQLAVAASERIVARHVSPLSPSALLAFAGPALGRIRVGPNRSARRTAAESCLPLLALSGAFRRVVRARGPLDRRLARTTRTSFPDVLPAPAIDTASVLSSLANGTPAPSPVRLPDGAIALPKDVDLGQRRGPLEELRKTFTSLEERARSRACSPLAIGDSAAAVRAALDPDVAVAGRARSHVTLPQSSRVHLSNRLDPIMAAPTIPTPMIGPLQEFGPDWLLPGIGDVPPNTVTIVEPDTAFIEAYMVGLNHEMGRELLWRGFPTDQRGTVFARFWDRRGSVPTETAPLPETDIPPIHEWTNTAALGTSMNGGGGDLLVLLVRGDVFDRFPRTTVYAQRARWQRDTGNAIVFVDQMTSREPVPLPDARAWNTDARFPSFIRRAGADITFLGFPLAAKDVHGIARRDAVRSSTDDEAGWYVVFQEQPTEPRFGPGTTALPAPAARRSDALAAQLLRPAFRLFVHGSDLLPD